MVDSETIYALSSAPGRAGIAVVRLSGPGAPAALTALAPSLRARPRVAHRVRLLDPADESPIDDGLVLAFPGPASFSGEDMVELHVHGSPAVLQRLFAVLGRLGLRPAEPGEFTRRAFAHGKLDLTEAEGLADLIAADSDSQRLQALAQMEGAWRRRVEGWQAALLDALAWLEAGIDFADEDDVPDGVDGRAADPLRRVAADMASVLADDRAGEITREGLRVAIIGPPNVGKSTLLNLLAGRDAAIVSDRPGTTRDVVEVRLDLAGRLVILADTAGLRDSADPIELEGMRRSAMRADEANLRIAVVDGSDSGRRVGLETESLLKPGDIVFFNKADLGGSAMPVAGMTVVSGSAGNGDVEALLAALSDMLGERPAGSALITRARHRQAVTEARQALDRALAASADLAAEDVRVALGALARVLGRFDVEDVLDRIFGAFCIGK